MKQRKHARCWMTLDGHAKVERKARVDMLPRVAHTRLTPIAVGVITIACAAGATDALMRRHMVAALAFGGGAAVCLLLTVVYACAWADERRGLPLTRHIDPNHRERAAVSGVARKTPRADGLTMPLLLAALVIPTTVATIWQVSTGYIWEGSVVGGVTLICAATVATSLLHHRI